MNLSPTVADFEKILDPNAYQVFFFCSPAAIPLAFACHPWIVINNKGVVSRYEVFWRPQKWHDRWGQLHKNFYPPTQGLAVLPFTEKFTWKRVSFLGYVTGEKGSLAEEMLHFVESSSETYPYRERYALHGPNSNTYVQWVLDHFKDAHIKLPWNAFGRSVMYPEIKTVPNMSHQHLNDQQTTITPQG